MAFIIDMALLFFFGLALFLFAGELVIAVFPHELAGTIKGLGAVLVIFPCVFTLSIIIYFTLLHSLGGKTLGKIFMGIRVESNQGKRLSFGVSFLRFVGYLPSFLPLGIGFLWAVLDKDQAAWHDKLADSRVVFDY